jgi:hypothetical protein
MWDPRMDINLEDETFYTTHYQEAYLKYVENEYCSKQRCLQVIEPNSIPNNNHFPSTMTSRYSHSSSHPYDLSSGVKVYCITKSLAEKRPGSSYCAACQLIAARLYLNSMP